MRVAPAEEGATRKRRKCIRGSRTGRVRESARPRNVRPARNNDGNGCASRLRNMPRAHNTGATTLMRFSVALAFIMSSGATRLRIGALAEERVLVESAAWSVATLESELSRSRRELGFESLGLSSTSPLPIIRNVRCTVLLPPSLPLVTRSSAFRYSASRARYRARFASIFARDTHARTHARTHAHTRVIAVR